MKAPLRVHVRQTPSLPREFFWHASCRTTHRESKESAMLANLTAMTVNPMFLRHDLLIELGRVEIAISDLRNQLQAPANEHDHLAVLEGRRATISQALGRIPA
jgi:hypothetical protein